VACLRDPEGRPLAQRNAKGDERLTFYGLSHGSLPLEVVTEDGEVITEIVVEGVRFGQKRSGEAKPTPIVTDPRGAVLQLGGETLPAFGAFGENTQGPSAFDERHLFAGLESIPEAPGVMLAQHRAYHPRTGRFLSPDPLGLAGGMHRTRYAEGDGVNLVDPTGWTATGLNDPATMDVKDDAPLPGTDGGSDGDGAGEGRTFCSENAFACGGNDAGGGDVLRRMLILNHGDLDEPKSEVDAEEGSNPRGEEDVSQEGDPKRGDPLTRLAEWREGRGEGRGKGLFDKVSKFGDDDEPGGERAETLDEIAEELFNVAVAIAESAQRKAQNAKDFINDLKDAAERQGIPQALKALASAGLDSFQALLGIAGLYPVLGEIADGLDLLISLARGDPVGVALGIASLNPFGGQVAGLAKIVRNAERAVSGVRALENVAQSTRKAAVSLPDNALVCRGGTCTAERFLSGSGVNISSSRKLSGVSVNSAPGASLEDLTKTIPNKQVGVTTVGDIRTSGGDVISSPTPNNPAHCTMCGVTPEQAESLFTPTVPNPNR
jgi:RHS repeat-associated protein